MAVLTEQQRWSLWAEAMRDEPLGADRFACTKDGLRAAINALDAWLESQASEANLQIPQPARNQLTARQKTILVGLIALKRARVI